IVDDDLPPTVQFAQPTFEVDEAGGAAQITVTLSAASGLPITVDYATSDGTAQAGADYTADSGALNFAPGETSQVISVPITDDLLDEGDETLALALSNPTNATLGAAANAVLTIADNDALVRLGKATYSVNEEAGSLAVEVLLNTALDHPVTVHVATSDDTATAGSDYVAINSDLTFATGETSKQLLVQISDDAADEADESFTIALSNPNGAKVTAPGQAVITIVDNDEPLTVQFAQADYSVVESSGVATIEVTLSRAASAAVAVEYATSNGTASAGQDYVATTGVLNFAPGETTKTFAVTIADDTVDEADETVVLTLSSPTVASLGAPAQATLTITDDDDPPTVQFESSFLGVPEGAPLFTFAVTLSSASDMTITVEYGSTNPAGQEPNGLIGGVLTFAPGQTSQSVTIDATQLATELETGITVQLLSATNATLGSQSSATLIFVNTRIYLP
ncbi:MAG: Calx-beta domain-containing protein, partial [Caldilineaceae bacterium]